MENLLVIKSNYNLNAKECDNFRRYFINSKAEGVVLIPLGFDVINAPDDVDIRVMNSASNIISLIDSRIGELEILRKGCENEIEQHGDLSNLEHYYAGGMFELDRLKELLINRKDDNND